MPCGDFVAACETISGSDFFHPCDHFHGRANSPFAHTFECVVELTSYIRIGAHLLLSYLGLALLGMIEAAGIVDRKFWLDRIEWMPLLK